MNLLSGNKKIDDFIQERQLKIKNHNDVVLEWIPYSQFTEIKRSGENNLIKVYSAIWRDGPLSYDWEDKEYIRNPNKEVTLKFFHDSQNSINLVINEAENYFKKKNSLITVYSAIWMDCPLTYYWEDEEHTARDPNKEVALKFLHGSNDSQNPVEFVINEVIIFVNI
ncbi:kinase-like domain-containing protein [Rhizophagus clarus]|uniref:Kinase-like domain-containing protein n=1 Tax=Rhizophagus clarus TaxID=94130 RepID=A0A8H3L7X5_9GLOM|nr:kinase-like domain-containing protein [Rhizophagus clarus]